MSKPSAPYLTLSVPNRTVDLQDYWNRLYHEDITVPPLKQYLAHEGERVWKQLLAVGECGGSDA